MITVEEYFGAKAEDPEATQEVVGAAAAMLERVNRLLDAAEGACGYLASACPNTGTQISGSRGGAGDGGFRLSGSTTGAAKSAHKLGRAVDVYDPADLLDHWLTDEKLEEFGLYREAPSATPGWCHLQDLAPHSGHRTFFP